MSGARGVGETALLLSRLLQKEDLLYLADEDGALVVDEPALSGEWARPGFAIGEDHLAWATRDGQDGKGSHVKVVAWTDDGIGAVETKPGEDVLVVQR